jgi:hypothetical protein
LETVAGITVETPAVVVRVAGIEAVTFGPEHEKLLPEVGFAQLTPSASPE